MSQARRQEAQQGTVPPNRGQRLLRWISALGILSLLGAGAYLLMRWEPTQLPVRRVSVEGKLERLSPQRLQKTVVEHLSGGILTQDLAKLKEAVEAMPWVESVSLRRHWPDRLELRVVERVAAARWGQNALVTADGVVFKPQDGPLPKGLARILGRPEQAPLLVERLRSWNKRLQPLSLSIEQLAVDARGAWSLHLSPEIELALGTARVQERISRFARVYPNLIAAGMPSQVDMRYSNGLAIRWAAPSSDGSDPKGRRKTRSAQLKDGPTGAPRS